MQEGKNQEPSIGEVGREKEALKRKLGEECVYCGCTNKLALTIDHKVPLSRGGGNTEENKQVTCFVCNMLKDSLTDQEFRSYLKNLYELKDLCKVRLVLPRELKLDFNHRHHPEYNRKPARRRRASGEGRKSG